MSALPTNALDAVASQLVAALEKYDRDSGVMIACWPDLDRYRDVSAQVETIRMYSSALPAVRVQWVELLIAHAELIHFLWRTQYGANRDALERIVAVRDHHADCIAALRNRCLRVAGRGACRSPGEFTAVPGPDPRGRAGS